MKIIFLILLFSLHLLTVLSTKTGPTHNNVVICNYQSWAIYRDGLAKLDIDNIDLNQCTHLLYLTTLLSPHNDSIVSNDHYLDFEYGLNSYKHIINLKEKYPHIKILLTTGGWIQGSYNFSQIANNERRRRNFAINVSKYIRTHKFDGFHLHWLWPGKRDGMDVDKINLPKLLHALKNELRRHKLLLACTCSGQKYYRAAFDVIKINEIVDFMLLATQDYAGIWEKQILPTAPLVSSSEFIVDSITDSVQYYLAAGASPSKLVICLQTSGRAYITDYGKNITIGQAAEEYSFAGPLLNADNYFAYYEICYIMKNITGIYSSDAVYTSFFDPTSAQVFLIISENISPLKVIVYDSTRSAANKARFVVQNGLAGVYVADLDTDDFNKICDIEDTFNDYIIDDNLKKMMNKIIKEKNYPILRTINHAFVLARIEV